MSKEKVDVILRVFTHGGAKGKVIALFPAILATNTCIQSYMKLGQHSAQHYWTILQVTKIVKKDKLTPEAKELLKELKRIGYNVNVVNKMTEKHRNGFNEQFSRLYKREAL